MKILNDDGDTGKPELFGDPVPVYFNPASGSSGKVLERIRNDTRITMEAVSAVKLAEMMKRAVEQGDKRVLVSGGDGTIALAASHLAGKATELAVIPSGTLNHFAQRAGIPTHPLEALEVALHGKARSMDTGYVNDRLFINTSSVGAYPAFIRSRKYLQNRMPYFPASIIAGIRRLLKFRLIHVSMSGTLMKTPLVFIGVGERELRLPTLGQVKKQGQKGLHLIAADCGNSMDACRLVINSLFFGLDPLQKGMRIKNQLVDAIELNFHHHRSRIHVALDGESVWLRAPLRYLFAPGEIMVATPPWK